MKKPPGIDNLFEKLQKLLSKGWIPLLWFLFLAITCYGILISKLGFYWDDLPYLYQFTAFGSAGFPAYVAPDRPFSAWIFMATTAIFKFNPIGYHLMIMLLRWGCAILIFEICKQLWRNNRNTALVIASLSLIYPGFSQQPIALIYIHHFIVFSAFLMSVYLMILFQRNKKKRGYLVLSIILAFGMFSIENFATLELIRPFILFKLLRGSHKTNERKQPILAAIQSWMPYLVVFLIFLYWRVIIFSFPTYKPLFLAEFITSPFEALGTLFARIPEDFFRVYLQSWFYNFSIPQIRDFGRLATFMFWGITILLFLISFFFFYFVGYNRNAYPPAEKSSKDTLEMFTGSIILFFLAGMLIWMLDLELTLDYSANRMTLAFIPGISLFFGSLYTYFKNKSQLITLLVAILIAASVGAHFQNEIAYKRDWENLQIFLSQLSWRIPSLSENTIFITSDDGLQFYSDSSLTSPINLMYMDVFDQENYDHLVYKTYSPRSVEWFTADDHNADYSRIDRSFTFRGSSANVIAFIYRPPGCVQLLDKEFANSISIANLTDLQLKELAFTNLDIIEPFPEHAPFPALFAGDSHDSWCFYFEKADLARQFGDFEEIERLGEEAIYLEKSPRIASEWLPFLEGYLWTGNFNRAEWVINQIESNQKNYRTGMCYTLNRIASNQDYPFGEEITEMIHTYCLSYKTLGQSNQAEK